MKEKKLKKNEFYYYFKNIKKIKTAFNLEFLEWMRDYGGNKSKVFDKPPSSYLINHEEIFCEMFANYMMYDLRLLHSDNYRILKTLIPELRN